MAELRGVVIEPGKPPETRVWQIDDSENATLNILRATVDGPVACVEITGDAFTRGIDLWIDEEGVCKELPVLFRPSSIYDDYIVGPGIFVAHGPQGETLSLSDEELREVKERIIPTMRAPQLRKLSVSPLSL
jgi:Domain of unknown function (DUF3846)